MTLPAATPETGFDTWLRGDRTEGMTKGMLQGFFVGAVAGGAYTSGVGAVVGAPLGLVIGGARGAEYAVPDATADEIDTFVAARFDGQGLAGMLRDGVVAAAGRETGLRVKVLDPDPAPTSADACPAAAPRMTLLELTFTGYGFAGGGGSDPDLAVVLGVQGRIIDAETCEERHAVALTYVGAERKYGDWQAHAATTLQDEIRHGVSALAEKIVEELFLLYLPEDARRETTDKVAGRGGAAPWG